MVSAGPMDWAGSPTIPLKNMHDSGRSRGGAHANRLTEGRGCQSIEVNVLRFGNKLDQSFMRGILIMAIVQLDSRSVTTTMHSGPVVATVTIATNKRDERSRGARADSLIQRKTPLVWIYRMTFVHPTTWHTSEEFCFMTRHRFTSLSVLLLLPLLHQPLLAANLFGPTPYLSSADVPSGIFESGVTELETFEDDSLSPNIKASAGAVVRGPEDPPPQATDSVDADDGVIDGLGNTARSMFCACGPTGITLTFPDGTTEAGLVWTDGAGAVTFEAFGPNGSLGSISGSDFVDNSVAGTTGDDRFFGVSDPNGITSVRISNTIGGIEIDHIQYRSVPIPIPEPSSACLGAMGIGCIGMLRRRKSNR